MTLRSDHDTRQMLDFDAELGSSVEETAALWLVRLSSGETTAEERAEFTHWRRADPAHEAALSSMRAIWSALPVEASVQPTVSASMAMPQRAAPPRPLHRRRHSLWALAASLLLGIALLSEGLHDWRHDVVTGHGERRRLTLADGSTAVLASGSALDIDLHGPERRITLVRGEAYFNVRHDSTRPFVVLVGRGEARDVGTRFSVRRDGDAVRVVVADGLVNVSGDNASVLLHAGQQVILADGLLSKASASDAAQDLAWADGRLVLDNATLVEAVRQLNRYGSERIVMLASAQRQRRVNAVIDLAHVDEWLAGVERQGWARVAHVGPATLLY